VHQRRDIQKPSMYGQTLIVGDTRGLWRAKAAVVHVLLPYCSFVTPVSRANSESILRSIPQSCRSRHQSRVHARQLQQLPVTCRKNPPVSHSFWRHGPRHTPHQTSTETCTTQASASPPSSCTDRRHSWVQLCASVLCLHGNWSHLELLGRICHLEAELLPGHPDLNPAPAATAINVKRPCSPKHVATHLCWCCHAMAKKNC